VLPVAEGSDGALEYGGVARVEVGLFEINRSNFEKIKSKNTKEMKPGLREAAERGGNRRSCGGDVGKPALRG
jgi:hypothetical protein